MEARPARDGGQERIDADGSHYISKRHKQTLRNGSRPDGRTKAGVSASMNYVVVATVVLVIVSYLSVGVLSVGALARNERFIRYLGVLSEAETGFAVMLWPIVFAATFAVLAAGFIGRVVRSGE